MFCVFQDNDPYLQLKSLSNGIQPLIPLSMLLCSLYIFSHSSLNIDARSHNKKFRQLDTRLDWDGGAGRWRSFAKPQN